jgi:hypothetical protein
VAGRRKTCAFAVVQQRALAWQRAGEGVDWRGKRSEASEQREAMVRQMDMQAQRQMQDAAEAGGGDGDVRGARCEVRGEVCEAGGSQGERWEEQQGVSREGAERICMDA